METATARYQEKTTNRTMTEYERKNITKQNKNRKEIELAEEMIGFLSQIPFKSRNFISLATSAN